MMSLANFHNEQLRQYRRDYGAGMDLADGMVADGFYKRHKDEPTEVIERYLRIHGERSPKGFRGKLELLCETFGNDGNRRAHILAARRIIRERD